jgi:hypothetical protein
MRWGALLACIINICHYILISGGLLVGPSMTIAPVQNQAAWLIDWVAQEPGLLPAYNCDSQPLPVFPPTASCDNHSKTVYFQQSTGQVLKAAAIPES